MSKRKQTPDVLAEILGGSPNAADVEEFEAPPLPKTRPTTPRPASVPKSTATSKAPAVKKTATQPVSWEYCIVSFHQYHGLRPRYRNGLEYPNWAGGPLIHDFLLQMGNEGWELVAASAGERMYGREDRHQLYFKRPK